jgi:hypothetical protein
MYEIEKKRIEGKKKKGKRERGEIISAVSES